MDPPAKPVTYAMLQVDGTFLWNDDNHKISTVFLELKMVFNILCWGTAIWGTMKVMLKETVSLGFPSSILQCLMREKLNSECRSSKEAGRHPHNKGIFCAYHETQTNKTPINEINMNQPWITANELFLLPATPLVPIPCNI